ncbi:MAG: hypothetical protein EOP24_24325 [Hyphomicrobiales bacterium]|nr:MAG: hypothetical protein EOP24_24325 [Hyphomicrobiales bacterium]
MCLLPLREKVPEGRMGGISPRTGSLLATLEARYTSLRVPVIRRCAPPSPSRGEGRPARG